MLCYVMLCYVMLCYVMLCYVMLGGDEDCLQAAPCGWKQRQHEHAEGQVDAESCDAHQPRRARSRALTSALGAREGWQRKE